MEDYQLRVMEEKEQLDTKMEALNKFITGKSKNYTNLPKDEKADLKTQYSAMQVYSQALERRINRFE